MLALLLVAASVGIDNFAAAIAIGISGVDLRTRVRVGVVFGVFEGGMPVAGLAIGHDVAGALGDMARWVGAGLLIAVGSYQLVSAVREHVPGQPDAVAGDRALTAGSGLGRLLLTGLALSLDNLVVGFALGAYRTSILAGAVTIGLVSTALSLIGLEIGARLATLAGKRAEMLAALILIAVGAAIAGGALR